MTSPSENDFMEPKFSAFFRYALVIGCLLGKCLNLSNLRKYQLQTWRNPHWTLVAQPRNCESTHHEAPFRRWLGIRLQGLNTRNVLKPLVKITRIEILQKQHMCETSATVYNCIYIYYICITNQSCWHLCSYKNQHHRKSVVAVARLTSKAPANCSWPTGPSLWEDRSGCVHRKILSKIETS